jgi:hypothetical protein
MTTIGSTPREEKWASHNLLSTNRNDKINPEIYIYIYIYQKDLNPGRRYRAT